MRVHTCAFGRECVLAYVRLCMCLYIRLCCARVRMCACVACSGREDIKFHRKMLLFLDVRKAVTALTGKTGLAPKTQTVDRVGCDTAYRRPFERLPTRRRHTHCPLAVVVLWWQVLASRMTTAGGGTSMKSSRFMRLQADTHRENNAYGWEADATAGAPLHTRVVRVVFHVDKATVVTLGLIAGILQVGASRQHSQPLMRRRWIAA